MSPRPAHEEACHWGGWGGPPLGIRHWPGQKHLVQRHGAVEYVAPGQPEGLVQGWRGQHVLAHHRGLAQGLFLGTRLGTHTSTMSRDVTDIHEDRADFESSKVVWWCHFL